MSRSIKDYSSLASNEKWAVSYSLRRLNGLPKFIDEIFSSLQSLESYLAQSAGLIYDGQVFRVVDTEDGYSTTFYYAHWDGSAWEAAPLFDYERDIQDSVAADIANYDYSGIIQIEIQNYDYSNIVKHEIMNYDFASDANFVGIIESIIGNYDYSSIVQNEIQNYNYSSIVQNEIVNYDFANDANFVGIIESIIGNYDYSSIVKHEIMNYDFASDANFVGIIESIIGNYSDYDNLLGSVIENRITNYNDYETILGPLFKGYLPKKTKIVLEESDYTYDPSAYTMNINPDIESNHLYIAEVKADPNQPGSTFDANNEIKFLHINEFSAPQIDNTIILVMVTGFQGGQSYSLLLNRDGAVNDVCAGSFNATNCALTQGAYYMIRYMHGIHMVEEVADFGLIFSAYSPDNVIEP